MIINIGRQLASGGKTIGSMIAKELGLNYYDKDILRIAAHESGLTSEVFERVDEQPNKGIVGNFSGFSGIGAIANLTPINYNTGLSNEELFRIQSDVIQNLAIQGPSVFVGRCADYILRSRTDCLNIFFSANMHDRVERIRQNNAGMTEKEAIRIIEETDKERADYYNFYTNKQWGVATSYHLCINTSVLGIEKTKNLIIDFIKSYDFSLR